MIKISAGEALSRRESCHPDECLRSIRADCWVTCGTVASLLRNDNGAPTCAVCRGKIKLPPVTRNVTRYAR